MSKFDNNNIGNYLLKVNGTIIFHLQNVLDKRQMTKYKLSKITNIRYDTICNYCNGNVTLINVEYLKIFCSVLNCKIEDILEFRA
ncbi:MAG: helix-turn-helix transcriptional regulator [Clostridia bacterium]|nr:helix-turn-helix transcriptional regulator [Clostridia bacterium]